MKLTLVIVGAVVAAVRYLLPGFSLLAVILLTAAFTVYGLARSVSSGINPFNDLPNAFRVLLASLGSWLLFRRPGLLGASSGILLFVSSILLNDEYQRRTLDSLRRGRRGGVVALLGIDGSGKSTHASELESWFKSRGYYCTRVPFHRYLFVEALRSRTTRPGTRGVRRGGNPLRPLASAADNLMLYLMTAFGRGEEGRVVVYDRFPWSTFVKYEGLGYPVRPLKWLYLLPRPKFAIVLDVPTEKSLGVIETRSDHIRYARDVLAKERSSYLDIARERGCRVIDATRDSRTVQADLERMLAPVFPEVRSRQH